MAKEKAHCRHNDLNEVRLLISYGSCFGSSAPLGCSLRMLSKRGLPYDSDNTRPDKRLRENLADLVSRNTISANRGQQIVNDALAAGAAHVGDWVGGAGSSVLSGNVAKRLRRRMAKGRGWPPLYECSVRGWCPKRRCEQPMKCYVLLPHEVVDKLCFFGDMNVIMGQSGFDAVTARHVRNASAQLGETPLGVGLWQDGVPCYWDRSISCEILSLFFFTRPGQGTPQFQMPIGCALEHTRGHVP